jgi:glycosyltransferase involved in cell wall biosynthesis
LILSSWYPSEEQPFLGNFVRQQAMFLSSRFKVTVVHTCPSITCRTFDIKQTEEGNLSEIRVTYPLKRFAWQRFKAKTKAYQLGFTSVQSKVDFIHGHVLLPNLPFYSAAKKHFCCPLVVTEHSSAFRGGQKLLSWTHRAILKKYVSQINHLFAVSEFQRKDLVNISGNAPLTVLNNPVDLHFFVPSDTKPEGDFRFIHISTLDEHTKNPYGILHAIALLKRNSQQRFIFTILSDEPKEKWEAYSDALGISDCVRFEGPCHPQEVVHLLHKSHALVHFSNYESFSLVLAEAWACGIPVISTPVGIADGMNKKLGTLVPIGDEDALAEAMTHMIENHTLFDSEWIHAYASRFSVEAYAAEISKVLCGIIC